MIYYDVTKMAGKAARSGLTRLSGRLQQELEDSVVRVSWDTRLRAWVRSPDRSRVAFASDDWLMTVELFSESERPGIRGFLENPPCRLAALFYDAIPVRFPHITWPQSVARHPEYMKLLSRFDRLWAISEATRRDFLGFWKWQGATPRGTVEVVTLGADFDGSQRETSASRDSTNSRQPSLLCVGIIEPRKNQSFLLDVATVLWRSGVDFELHVVGRVNPHFGRPIERRMRTLARHERRFRFHAAASDATLGDLYSEASAVVFPTIAEGCGLPILESLWRGVPCVCSDLPVLRENADGGGCLTAAVDDPADWIAKLRRVLADSALQKQLRLEASTRPLPTWAHTARTILDGLR